MSFQLAVAAVVLVGTVGLGTVVHELTHAAVLRALGVPYDVSWGAAGGADGFAGWVRGEALATVTPRDLPPGLSPWGLRLAAVAPFALAVPLLLVPLGVLPDPLAAGDPVRAVVVVAWLGCALPSPQDFSLFWYADGAVASSAGERGA